MQKTTTNRATFDTTKSPQMPSIAFNCFEVPFRHVHTCPFISPYIPLNDLKKPFLPYKKQGQKHLKKTTLPTHKNSQFKTTEYAQNKQDLSLNLPCENEQKINHIPTPNYTTSKAIFKRCYSITRKQMGSASGLYANNPHYAHLTSSDYLFLMRNRRASIAASQIESIRLTNSSECKFAFNKLLYSIFKNKEINSAHKSPLRLVINNSQKQQMTHQLKGARQ